MAFSDFLDLRTAVFEQIGRSDIADVFPRLTQLAEARFNREIRFREQVTEVTLTFSGGAASLPSDFAEISGLYDQNGYEYIAQPLQSVRTSGTGCYYALAGSEITTFNGDGDRVLQYYAKIPTITASMTDTNWLLSKYPSVYLYAVAYEAAKHIRDLELAQAMRTLYGEELADAKANDARERNVRARVRVQGPTP